MALCEDPCADWWTLRLSEAPEAGTISGGNCAWSKSRHMLRINLDTKGYRPVYIYICYSFGRRHPALFILVYLVVFMFKIKNKT